MLNTDYLTTEKLHLLILEHFDINYSYKQVRIIAHQLGFSYVKPYPEYDKTPPDAELQLKKNAKAITLENYIIGFMDQTSAQNLPNSARILVCKDNKGKVIKNPNKYRVNTVGFQAVNGNSL